MEIKTLESGGKKYWFWCQRNTRDTGGSSGKTELLLLLPRVMGYSDSDNQPCDGTGIPINPVLASFNDANSPNFIPTRDLGKCRSHTLDASVATSP